MKLRLLALLAVAILSLAFGGAAPSALAQSGNETAPSISIGTGNGPPVQPGTGTPQINPLLSGNETVKFKNVFLWVNPEYDDSLKLNTPSVLVMLEGQLDGLTAPVTVRFLVPSEAEMYSAGSKDATGTYSGGPPNRTASQTPGWDEVSYTLTQQTFRVEYYDTIIAGQTDKTISYDFRTISPITNLTVVVQEPRQSSKFTVTSAGFPSPGGATGTDGEGYTIHSYFKPSVTADAPVNFEISYSKGGANSTALIIGIVLVVIVIGGAVLFWLKSRKPRYLPVRSSGKGPKKRAAKKGGQGTRFCTKCGEPARPDDKFCLSCGTKLRDAA